MRFSVMPPHGPLRRWGLYRITLVVVSKVVRRVSRRAGRTGSRSRSEKSARAAFFGGCSYCSCSCSHSTQTFFVVLPILLLDVSFTWNSSLSLGIDSFELASTHLPERRVVMGGYLGVERQQRCHLLNGWTRDKATGNGQ